MRLLTGVGKPGQIGASLAAAFASQDDTLLLVGRHAQEAEARAEELRTNGADAFGYGADLTDSAAVGELVNRIRREHGPSLTALVHAAGGFAMSGPVGESDVSVWDTQLAINLRTAYLTSRAFLPMLRSGRGSLVFFASEKALPGASVAHASAYAVAKIGVVTLMRAIAAEERTNGVRANAVAPATVRTDVNVAAMGADAEYVELAAVSAAVSFLCSPAAAAITGQVIRLK
jgi:NAD(P)-dependent dehydrogenase (short-subunit alcohol dehydrogenase family)